MKRITPDDRRKLAAQAASFSPRKPVKRGPSAALLRQIMTEKALTPYIKLICGHYTHVEDIEMNSCWQPAKDLFWCNECQFWTAKIPPVTYDSLPEVPPF